MIANPTFILCLALLCQGLTSACGPITKVISRRDAEPAGTLSHERFGSPLIYERADPDCDATHAVADLGKVKIWLSIHGVLRLEEVDFTGFSGHGLKSAGIANTLYAYEETTSIRKVIHKNRQEKITYSQQTTNPGKTLYFCPRQTDFYPRDSLENVALAAASGIAAAFHRHAKNLPDHKLSKTILLVHPRLNLVTTLKDRLARTTIITEQVRTDNAFWTMLKEKSRQTFTIAALPHSQENFIPYFRGISFWETPGWFAHEYGHHIFYAHAPHVAAAELANMDTRSAHAHAKEANIPSAADAINEGFADLIAFYSYQDTRRHHANLQFGGFHHNRSVISCESDCSEVKKVLDDHFLYYYFNDTTYVCAPGEPSPRDPHALGAIIAHGVHRLISDATSPAITSDATAGAGQVIAWAQRLELLATESGQNVHGRQFLIASIKQFVVQIQEAQEGSLNAAQCNTLATIFPAFIYENSSFFGASCPARESSLRKDA